MSGSGSGLESRNRSYAFYEEAEFSELENQKPSFSDPIEIHARWIFQNIFIPKLKGMARPLTVHGLLHASRVAHYIPMLYRLYRGIDPSLPELTPDEIKAAQLAGLFHDMAREDDGVDHWDIQSAEMAYQYLSQNIEELPLGMAEFVANIAANKDAVETGESHRIQVGMGAGGVRFDKAPNNSLGFDKTTQQKFLESLLHDADCLDIMRCCKRFDTAYLHISKLPGMYPEYLGLLKDAVFQLIHLEKDQAWTARSSDTSRYIRNPDCFTQVAEDIEKIPVLKLLTLPLPRIIPKQFLGELRMDYDNPIQFEYESQGLLVRGVGRQDNYSNALNMPDGTSETHLDIELKFASSEGGNTNRCASLLVPGLIPVRPLNFILKKDPKRIHFMNSEDADTGWGSRLPALLFAFFQIKKNHGASVALDKKPIISLEGLLEAGLKAFPSYRDPSQNYRHNELHLDYDLSDVEGVMYSTEHISSCLDPAQCFIHKLEAIVAVLKIQEITEQSLKIYEYRGITGQVIEKSPREFSQDYLLSEAQLILESPRSNSFQPPLQLNETLQRYFPSLQSYISGIWRGFKEDEINKSIEKIVLIEKHCGIFGNREFALSGFNHEVENFYNFLSPSQKNKVAQKVFELIDKYLQNGSFLFLSHDQIQSLLDKADLKKLSFFEDFPAEATRIFLQTVMNSNILRLDLLSGLNLIRWFDLVKHNLNQMDQENFLNTISIWLQLKVTKNGVCNLREGTLAVLFKLFSENVIGLFFANNFSFDNPHDQSGISLILSCVTKDREAFFKMFLQCFNFNARGALGSILRNAPHQLRKPELSSATTNPLFFKLHEGTKLLFVLAKSEHCSAEYLEHEIQAFLHSFNTYPLILKDLISIWDLPMREAASLDRIREDLIVHFEKLYIQPDVLDWLISNPSDSRELLKFLNCVAEINLERASVLRGKMATALIARCDWLESRIRNWIELLQGPLVIASEETQPLFVDGLLLTAMTTALMDTFRKALEHRCRLLLPGATMDKSSLRAFRAIIDLVPERFRTPLLEEFFPANPVHAAHAFYSVSAASATPQAALSSAI